MKIQDSQYLSALQIPNQFPGRRTSTREAALQKDGVSFQDILAERRNAESRCERNQRIAGAC